MSSKWRILHKPLLHRLEVSTAIVQAIACLHNFIIAEELCDKETDRHYFKADSNIPVDNVAEIPEQCFENVEVQDEALEDENIVLEHLRQRQTLANYFMTANGAIR